MYLESYTINHLPVEILVHAFSFLEPKDLFLAERVSKCWQEACNCELLWRRHCESKHGINYLASLAHPHPKAAYTLPMYIKSFQHSLKLLPFQEQFGVLDRIKMYGQYLTIEEFTIKGPSLKVIFDLIRQEQIQVPEFFKETSFKEWTIFNNEQIVVIQNKKGELFFSKPPFDSKTIIEGLKGTLLDVHQNQLFLSSPDRNVLSQFNLGQNRVTYTQELDKPILSFYATEFAHVALFENEVIIFHDPSDLSKNFKVPVISKDFEVRVVSNKKWLVIAFEGWAHAFFLAYDIINGKLHTDLRSPSSYDTVMSEYILHHCQGLELCDDTLILTRRNVFIVQLNNIETNDKEPTIKTLKFHRYSNHLSSFANRFFFSVDEFDGKINYTDFLANVDSEIDLDLSMPKRRPNAITNGRFVVVGYPYENKLKYCDLLAPERTSSKHFTSLNDKRVAKKMRMTEFGSDW